MKKTPKITDKTPAPANKIIAPAPTPKPAPIPVPVSKPAVVPKVKKPAPAPAPASVPASASVAAAVSVPAPAPVSSAPAAAAPKPAPAATTISATIDVGFGNGLYIRGSGPGLSWNIGIPLTNGGSDQWSVVLSGATQPVTFKFLINDSQWSVGEDYAIAPGSSVSFTPVF
jgi:hypothetical protein